MKFSFSSIRMSFLHIFALTSVAIIGFYLGHVMILAYTADAQKESLAESKGIRSNATQLSVEDKYLHFGEVWSQREFKWDFVITNRSSFSIPIGMFNTSCQCTIVGPVPEIPLKPGKSITVPLQIDLSGEQCNATSADPIPFDVDVTLQVGERAPQIHKWKIVGGVRHAIAVTPCSLSFRGAMEVVAGTKTPTGKIAVRLLDDSVKEIEARCDPELGEVSIHSLSKRPRDFNIHFQPYMNTAHEKFKGSIYITPILGSSEVLPEVEIPVQGVVVPPIQVFPNLISFFGSQASLITSQKIQVRSKTSQPVSLKKAWSDIPKVKVDILKDNQVKVQIPQANFSDVKNGNVFIEVILFESPSEVIKVPIVFTGFPNS